RWTAMRAGRLTSLAACRKCRKNRIGRGPAVDARVTTVASKPPFRAEHIGSLLRPAELLRERERFARGEIGQPELTAAEDKAIRGAIKLQEQLGFKFVTDGEF